MGRNTHFIVTNLMGPRGKHLYEKIYSAHGQAENHIKGWKSHLASDRTSWRVGKTWGFLSMMVVSQ